MLFEHENFSELYLNVCKAMYKNGYETSPREMPIREELGVFLLLHNPRSRVLCNSARELPMHFAIGEWLWTITGRDDLSFIQYYASRYDRFSDDGVSLNGAYGPRIKMSWEKIISLLRTDGDSRRAVIPIYSPRDVGVDSKDIPCTTTLQFFIRNGKLDMIITMRSNDIYLGLPFDVFNFTMIQELLACQLGVELGSYRHFVGSFHYYCQYEERIGKIASGFTKSKQNMMPMNHKTINKELSDFIVFEEQLRLSGQSSVTISPYFEPLADNLIRFRERRKNS